MFQTQLYTLLRYYICSLLGFYTA